MIQSYDFCVGGTLSFDDNRSVRELIRYAFDQFGYYEPFGMDVVTLFQPQHPDTNTGWFITNPDATCADAIQIKDNLCFAYSVPHFFYYAEGGWGHHMMELGNHPIIENPVMLHLRFEDFNHTVVFNGAYTFNDIIRTFKNATYMPLSAHKLKVLAINPYQDPFYISFHDPIMNESLLSFEKKLPNSVTILCPE